MGSPEMCCAHCPTDLPRRGQRLGDTSDSPIVLGGPGVPIALAALLDGAIAGVWAGGLLPLVGAAIVGLPVAGWALWQFCAEVAFAWELRRPLPVGPPPVLDAIQVPPVRPAIEPLRMPPLKRGAFVIELEAPRDLPA